MFIYLSTKNNYNAITELHPPAYHYRNCVSKTNFLQLTLDENLIHRDYV